MTHPFDCNVYLLGGGKELALIDAGAGVEPSRILEEVEAGGFSSRSIKHVFLTHAHADHAGGAAALRELTGARVYASAREAQYLRDGDERELALDVARRSGGYSPAFRLRPCGVDVELRGGETLLVGDCEVSVIATPGHSRGSVCYLARAEGTGAAWLFSGDTVFECGRICLLNCRGASLEEYRESLVRLASLDVEAVFPGHLCFAVRGGREWLRRAGEYAALITVPPGIM